MEVNMSYLPDQAIKEFLELYRIGGMELSWEDATDKAESFIGIYNQVVYGKEFDKKEDQPMDKN